MVYFIFKKKFILIGTYFSICGREREFHGQLYSFVVCTAHLCLNVFCMSD